MVTRQAGPEAGRAVSGRQDRWQAGQKAGRTGGRLDRSR